MHARRAPMIPVSATLAAPIDRPTGRAAACRAKEKPVDTTCAALDCSTLAARE
jgi:hypothetical protein